MKNFVKLIGIIALVAVVMFGVAACDGGDDPSGGNSAFNGTWTNEADPDDKITITGTNWTRSKGNQTEGTLDFTETAPNPNEPNIFVDGGNVGFAKIVNGKLEWFTYQGGEATFVKGSGGNPGGDNPGGDNPGGSDITYTVEFYSQQGIQVIQMLVFYFNASVSGLTANDIVITPGTGSVTKGSVSGSDDNWYIRVSGVTSGTINVSINKAGIESVTKTVTVVGIQNPTSLVGTWTSDSATYEFTATHVTWNGRTETYSYNPTTGRGRIPASGQWIYDISPAGDANMINLMPSGSPFTLTREE